MTAEEVIALRAPQYSSDPRVPDLILLAEELIGDKIPNTTPREYAKALQVLHWLTISDRNEDGSGAVGSVSEEKEGELRIKYQNSSGNMMHFTSDLKGELGQTSWGLELYAFYKRYIITLKTRFC